MKKINVSKNVQSRINKLQILQEYLTTDKTIYDLKIKHKVGECDFIPAWINEFNIELFQLGYKQEIIDRNRLHSCIDKNISLIKLLKSKKSPSTKDLRYTKIQRYKIVEDYFSSGYSQLLISKKYKIKWRSTIGRWIKHIYNELSLIKSKYPLMLTNRQINLLTLVKSHISNLKPIRKHSNEFKKKIIQEYKSGSISQRKLARKYNISRGLVSHWIYSQRYQNKNSLNLSSQSSNKSSIIRQNIFESKATKIMRAIEYLRKNKRFEMNFDWGI